MFHGTSGSPNLHEQQRSCTASNRNSDGSMVTVQTEPNRTRLGSASVQSSKPKKGPMSSRSRLLGADPHQVLSSFLLLQTPSCTPSTSSARSSSPGLRPETPTSSQRTHPQPSSRWAAQGSVRLRSEPTAYLNWAENIKPRMNRRHRSWMEKPWRPEPLKGIVLDFSRKVLSSYQQ